MSSRNETRARIAGTLLAVATGLAGCKQEINFTKAPAYGSAPPAAVRREATAITVATTLDLAAARRSADEAVPEKFTRIVDWVTNAACAKRTQWVECAGARVDIDVARNGDVTTRIKAGLVEIEVPLKYEIATRGLGWASGIAETRKGELVATVAVEAGLDAAFAPDVRLREEIALSEPALPALKAKVAMGRHLSPKLRHVLAPVATALRKEMAGAGLAEATRRAWQVLHTPIELNRDLQVWLRAEPERVHAAGFAGDGDSVVYRTLILSRMTSFTGQRPPPLIPRPMPELSREAAADTRTRLELPVTISSDAMQASIRQAFPGSEILKTADGDAPPVAVRVREAQLHPARGLLGIELQLDVAEPGQWLGLMGSAHFVGKPVFRREGALIELESVSFPDQPPPKARPAGGQPPVSERERRVNKAIEGAGRGLRIGVEPFAGRIMKAARMDLTRALRDVVPHANSLLGQSLAEGLVLAGKFDTAGVSAVVPTREGFEVTFELTGSLVLFTPTTAANLVSVSPGPTAEQ